MVLLTRLLRRFEAGDDSGVRVGFTAMSDDGFVSRLVKANIKSIEHTIGMVRTKPITFE